MTDKMLAKSYNNSEKTSNKQTDLVTGCLLTEHIEDLLSVYQQVVEPLDFGDNNQKEMIWLACITHDLGKMNSYFQNKIYASIAKDSAEKPDQSFNQKPIFECSREKSLSDQSNQKEIRHNLLSPAFLLPIMEAKTLSDLDKNILVKAVMLHHGNFEKYLGISFSQIEQAIYYDIAQDILSNKAVDLAEVSDYLQAKLDMQINLSETELWYGYEDMFNSEITLDADDCLSNEELIAFEEKNSEKYIEVKGFLNLLDHIASSQLHSSMRYYFLQQELAALDQKLLHFIKKRIKSEKQDPNNLQQQIEVSLPEFNDIQKSIVQYTDKPLVITEAFTSAGKTICDDRLTAKKKLYLAPNRISAMSFYQEACEKYGKENVGVLHGNLHLYKTEKAEDQEAISLSTDDIDLARNFAKPYIVATVDQLATAIFKYSNYEKTLVVMKEARICLDEVHLLSPRMFRAFTLLMEYAMTFLDTKFHLMTATLPAAYTKELEELSARNPNLEPVVNRGKIETNGKQIRLHLNTDQSEVSEICQNALADNKRILIILNKIDDVIELCEDLSRKLGDQIKIQCLHSRFKEIELKHLYQRICQLDDDTQIWITTQTVEIALDIDFPVVVSDLSPLDSLIQRMGRNNRRGHLEAGEFYVLKQKENSVYSEVLLNETENVLKKHCKEVKNKIPLLSMSTRKVLLENYYQQPKIEKYFTNEFAEADKAIRNIFGLSIYTPLTGKVIMLDNQPYLNLTDTKKEAAMFFRDADVQVKVYLEEDVPAYTNKSSLLGQGITISGSKLLSLKRKGGIKEQSDLNPIYILKKWVYRYDPNVGLIFLDK